MSMTMALIIYFLLYGSAFGLLIYKRATAIWKFGLVSSFIFLTGAGILAFFPTQLDVHFQNSLQGLTIGLIQFFTLFPLLYYVRFIRVQYFGFSLQDTLRKIVILLVIPAIILLCYGNDLWLIFSANGNWLVYALIIASMVFIAFIRNKIYRLNIFHKLLGPKRYFKSFGIIYLIMLVHVAISEEFFFRVFLLGSLRYFGDIAAVLISSVFFGLLHVWFLDRKMGMAVRYGQAVTFHTTAGVLFGILWLKFPSFFVLVLLHAFLNSLFLVYNLAKKQYFSM